MLLLLCCCAILSWLGYRSFRIAPSIVTKDGTKLRSAPDRLFLLGHALKFIGERHLLLDYFVQCQRQYGFETLELSVPTLPQAVLVTDPKNLSFILGTETLFAKGDFVKTRTHDLFGHGIINATGDLWKAQRKAGLKFFSGKNLELMVDEVLPEAFAQVRKRLLDNVGKIVDMQSIFNIYTTTTMSRMAFDMELDVSHPFNKAFDYASDQVGRRFQNPLWPVTELLFGHNMRASLAEVKRFGKALVSHAKKERSRLAFESLADNSEPVFGSLIDSLLETFDDPQIVADSALNFLSAGKDTTAQSFTWTLYSLLQHPEALPPVQAEISTFMAGMQAERSDSKISMSDLQPANLPQLMAVYMEALRLYPPIPFEIQDCKKHTTLPDGTNLPENSVVVWCIWAINRAKEIHGEDADSFRPSRWLDTEGKFAHRNAFEFPVFNGGPRQCLGRKMAELMAMFLIISLFSEFELSGASNWGANASVRLPQNSLTLPMAQGLPCLVNSSSNPR